MCEVRSSTQTTYMYTNSGTYCLNTVKQYILQYLPYVSWNEFHPHFCHQHEHKHESNHIWHVWHILNTQLKLIVKQNYKTQSVEQSFLFQSLQNEKKWIIRTKYSIVSTNFYISNENWFYCLHERKTTTTNIYFLSTTPCPYIVRDLADLLVHNQQSIQFCHLLL